MNIAVKGGVEGGCIAPTKEINKYQLGIGAWRITSGNRLEWTGLRAEDERWRGGWQPQGKPFMNLLWLQLSIKIEATWISLRVLKQFFIVPSSLSFTFMMKPSRKNKFLKLCHLSIEKIQRFLCSCPKHARHVCISQLSSGYGGLS